MTKDQRRTVSVSGARRIVELVGKHNLRVVDVSDLITINDLSVTIIVTGNRVVLLSGYSDDIDEVL